MEDIIKIVKSLEDSGLLLKGVTETIQNEIKEQKGGFLSMLLHTLGAILPHLFTNFEIEKYYQNKPSVYSRDNLPKLKDGAYVINLNEYSDIETHWVDLYVINNVTYFDSFGVEHIPKEIRIFINNKNIKHIFLEYNHIIQ